MCRPRLTTEIKIVLELSAICSVRRPQCIDVSSHCAFFLTFSFAHSLIIQKVYRFAVGSKQSLWNRKEQRGSWNSWLFEFPKEALISGNQPVNDKCGEDLRGDYLTEIRLKSPLGNPWKQHRTKLCEYIDFTLLSSFVAPFNML
ncbi:uncharacterized protein LOC114872489 [Osmia bicornis bicornis]|uniref:uncharacterized protein LOC114872489 n=1 Tax=Osmia bicornis bicornis TaxID=1437191 RepID=UPI001EAF845D|nr:uncharacterized protein LOC114872489 [Osmia bicornis bicornis]